MNRYRVHVVHYRDCKNLVLRYKDPVTGKYVRSTVYRNPETGIETPTGNNRKAAEKLAEWWEKDLNEGRAQGRYAMTWAEFRRRYEDEVVPAQMRERTASKVATTFNAIERILPRIRDGKVSDLNAEAISRFQAALRSESTRSQASIAGYLNHLRPALVWAAQQDMIREVPKIMRIKLANLGRKAKGRPITGEEFERMIAAIPDALAGWRKLQREQRWKANRRAGKRKHKMHTDERPQVIAPGAAESWQYYLTGLWLSGLRLEESLALSWDRDDRPHIILTGKRPMLRFPGECQKNGKDQLCPITPDFAEHLLTTPQGERTGPVFRPLLPSGSRADGAKAGRMISLIGELAGVKVHTQPKSGKVKFASAHDLRRSFGTRWARKVTTAVLQKLMRHESISTTMGYYVDLDADELAEDLYEKYGQDATTPPKSIGIVSGIVGPGGPSSPGQETT